MPTIGRVVQGGPMIRIREDGETAEQQAKRLRKLARMAEAEDEPDFAESYHAAADSALSHVQVSGNRHCEQKGGMP